MFKKSAKYLAVLSSLSVLVACAQLTPLHTQNTTETTVQQAKTHRDHSGLAQYYDNLTNELTAKVQQHKAWLTDYEEHSNSYGRQGQDFKSHTTANLHYYEEAVANAAKQANFHRKVAADLLKQEYAQTGDSPDRADAHKMKVKLNANDGNLN